MLDTDEDIKRRKMLTLTTLRKFRNILNNKKTSLELKVKIFNTYLATIFLYNSELWTITNKHREEIDIFQRSLLRNILNIHWPETISNTELYTKTNQIPWSKNILGRRLRWIGHLLRLNESTPARTALQEAMTKTNKPPGRPKLTWLDQLKKDSELVLNTKSQDYIDKLQRAAADRDYWSELIGRAMSKDAQA